MRAVLLVSVCLAALLAASCGSGAAAGQPSDGTLVLEVGGSHGSLREALAAAGVAMGEPKRLRTIDPESAPVEPEPPPTREQKPPAEREPAPQPAPEPQPPPAPRYRTVVLERGQTLIHLAKIHLGNGNRFRELLAANGWTEAQARRLAEGTKVKVPVEDGSANGKR